MGRKQSFTKVTVTLPSELQKEYKQTLESSGMSLSSRLAILIKGDLKRLAKAKINP